MMIAASVCDVRALSLLFGARRLDRQARAATRGRDPLVIGDDRLQARPEGEGRREVDGVQAPQVGRREATGGVQQGSADAHEVDPSQQCVGLLCDGLRVLSGDVVVMGEPQNRAPQLSACQCARHDGTAASLRQECTQCRCFPLLHDELRQGAGVEVQQC